MNILQKQDKAMQETQNQNKNERGGSKINHFKYVLSVASVLGKGDVPLIK